MKELATLSWRILEAKLLYYHHPEKVTLTDSEYDEMEKRYKELCRTHNVEPTASAVGIDRDRPCVKLIEARIV